MAVALKLNRFALERLYKAIHASPRLRAWAHTSGFWLGQVIAPYTEWPAVTFDALNGDLGDRVLEGEFYRGYMGLGAFHRVSSNNIVITASSYSETAQYDLSYISTGWTVRRKRGLNDWTVVESKLSSWKDALKFALLDHNPNARVAGLHVLCLPGRVPLYASGYTGELRNLAEYLIESDFPSVSQMEIWEAKLVRGKIVIPITANRTTVTAR